MKKGRAAEFVVLVVIPAAVWLCIGCMDKWLTEIGRAPAIPNVAVSGERSESA